MPSGTTRRSGTSFTTRRLASTRPSADLRERGRSSRMTGRPRPGRVQRLAGQGCRLWRPSAAARTAAGPERQKAPVRFGAGAFMLPVRPSSTLSSSSAGLAPARRTTLLGRAETPGPAEARSSPRRDDHRQTTSSRDLGLPALVRLGLRHTARTWMADWCRPTWAVCLKCASGSQPRRSVITASLSPE